MRAAVEFRTVSPELLPELLVLCPRNSLVYAARPLPCRAMNSADAGACRRSLAGEAVRIPVLAAQHGIMGHAQAGLAQALAKAGLEHRPIVLGTALAQF